MNKIDEKTTLCVDDARKFKEVLADWVARMAITKSEASRALNIDAATFYRWQNGDKTPHTEGMARRLMDMIEAAR